MAYDQYWAASPVSGPVAAYSWVSTKMDEIISIVPAEKVVLGMPTYMRLWREVPSTEKANTMKAKSETLSMNRLMRLMDENNFNFIWDEDGQHYYIGYIKDDVLFKIWVEDGKSIRAKTAYANDRQLAGVATWRRGFETQDIWGIIEEELNK
jgi:spore germination protein YaaH